MSSDPKGIVPCFRTLDNESNQKSAAFSKSKIYEKYIDGQIYSKS